MWWCDRYNPCFCGRHSSLQLLGINRRDDYKVIELLQMLCVLAAYQLLRMTTSTEAILDTRRTAVDPGPLRVSDVFDLNEAR